MNHPIETEQDISSPETRDLEGTSRPAPPRGRIGKVLGFFKRHYIAFIAWSSVVIIVGISYYTGFDKQITAGLIILVGLVTQIFSNFFNYLMGFVGMVPVIGPMIVKIVTLPFFLIINAVSFIVAFFGLRRGEIKAVASSRLVVTTLLIGIVIGYIIGRVVT